MTQIVSENASIVVFILIAETLIILAGGLYILYLLKRRREHITYGYLPAPAAQGEFSTPLPVAPTPTIDIQEEVIRNIPIPETPSSEANLPNPPPLKSDKLTVLIIEDDPTMRELYIKALGKEYMAKGISNKAQEIEMDSEQFDITIFSESLFLTPAEHKEIIKRIRENDKTGDKKIVVIAENITDVQITNGYKEGVDLLLKKPFPPKLLPENLRTLYADLSIASLPPYRHLAGKPLSNSDRRFMMRLTSLLEETTDHDNESVSISMVAQRLAMSHSSLYKRLRNITGLSVIEFSNAHKINIAVKRMQEGEISINTISNECGFRDAKAFRQCFKAIMGIPPSQYIKNLQSESSSEIA